MPRNLYVTVLSSDSIVTANDFAVLFSGLFFTRQRRRRLDDAGVRLAELGHVECGPERGQLAAAADVEVVMLDVQGPTRCTCTGARQANSINILVCMQSVFIIKF